MRPMPGQPKEIVSVAEMARMLSMSRSRFYQLVARGIFPAPMRHPQTGRPLYDRAGQERCLEIRQTNQGANGEPVLFYAKSSPVSGPLNLRNEKPSQRRLPAEPEHDHLAGLRNGLRQLGIETVTEVALRTAIQTCFPDGIGQASPEELLGTVFRQLRQHPPDNAT